MLSCQNFASLFLGSIAFSTIELLFEAVYPSVKGSSEFVGDIRPGTFCEGLNYFPLLSVLE